jgi:hypothetical protein
VNVLYINYAVQAAGTRRLGKAPCRTKQKESRHPQAKAKKAAKTHRVKSKIENLVANAFALSKNFWFFQVQKLSYPGNKGNQVFHLPVHSPNQQIKDCHLSLKGLQYVAFGWINPRALESANV